MDEKQSKRINKIDVLNNTPSSCSTKTQESSKQLVLQSNKRTQNTEAKATTVSRDNNLSTTDPITDEEDTISEDLEVIVTEENQEYVLKITVGKLTRLGRHRSIWTSKFDSFFVVLTFLLSLDVLHQFAANLGNYGVYYIVAYVLVTFLVAFPLLYLELALGQYTSTTSYHLFDRMAPGFAGIGISSMLFNFFKIMSDQELMRKLIRLFAGSVNFLAAEMPWHSCFNSFNDENCYDLSRTCDIMSKQLMSDQDVNSRHFHGTLGDICYTTDLAVVRSFVSQVYAKKRPLSSTIQNDAMRQFLFPSTDVISKTINHYPFLSYHLSSFFCICLLFLISHASSRVIVNTSKTAMLLFVTVIICLLLRFIGELDEPQFYILSSAPDISKLFNIRLWVSALHLSLVSLKIGQGGLIFLGAQNRFNNNIMRDSFTYLWVMIFLPILYSTVHLLIIDSFKHHVEYGKQGLIRDEFEEITHSDRFAYNGHSNIQLLMLMQGFKLFGSMETIGICLYSIMGILITLCNGLIRLEVLVSSIFESFPSMENGGYRDRSTVTCSLLCIIFIFSYIFASSEGLKIQSSLDDIVYPALTLGIVFFELLVVCLCYGAGRLFVNISCMVNSAKTETTLTVLSNGFVAILWTVVIPVVILTVSVSRVIEGLHMLNTSLLGLPGLLTLGVLSITPIVFTQRFMNRWVSENGISALFKPNPHLWGARSKEDRDRVEKKERETRPTICC